MLGGIQLAVYLRIEKEKEVITQLEAANTANITITANTDNMANMANIRGADTDKKTDKKRAHKKDSKTSSTRNPKKNTQKNRKKNSKTPNKSPIKVVQIMDVACGIGNVITNKGGICVVLKLHNKHHIGITCAHFAAHQGKVRERNAGGYIYICVCMHVCVCVCEYRSPPGKGQGEECMYMICIYIHTTYLHHDICIPNGLIPLFALRALLLGDEDRKVWVVVGGWWKYVVG